MCCGAHALGVAIAEQIDMTIGLCLSAHGIGPSSFPPSGKKHESVTGSSAFIIVSDDKRGCNGRPVGPASDFTDIHADYASTEFVSARAGAMGPVEKSGSDTPVGTESSS